MYVGQFRQLSHFLFLSFGQPVKVKIVRDLVDPDGYVPLVCANRLSRSRRLTCEDYVPGRESFADD